MYLALYRKYRPSTFDDVISQPHITKTLINQVKNSQTAHAYLFTGSRGTGKTTCAKILSKAVNCLNPKEGNPCLTCEACLAIDNGVSDVIEIDAASNNSVDDVRALRDELNYLPVTCKYRVYIIDEAHMLSTSAFNALLKTIEEPPGHVVFILATTETHKVPATILSRCQRFDFRRININDSASRLTEIAAKENIKLDKDAALLISRLSEGGMRDALSLLDTCLSVTDSVTTDVVYDAVGIAGKDYLFEISRGVKENNPSVAVAVINNLYEKSKDITRLIDELIYHYRNLMLLKATPENKNLLSCLPSERDAYEDFAKELTLSEILRSMRILENAFERIGRSKNAKITAEMTVIELCSPGVDFSLSALAARLNVLEEKLSKNNFIPPHKESFEEINKHENTPQKSIQSFANINTENKAQVTGSVETPPKYEIPKTIIAEKTQADFKNKSFDKNKSDTNESAAMSFFAEIPPPWETEVSEIPPPPFDVQQEAVTANAAPSFDVQQKAVTANVPPSFDVHQEVVTANGMPFSPWKPLIAGLPPYLSEMLSDTDASVEGDVLLVTGGALSGALLENPVNCDMILEQVEKQFGKKYILRFKEIKQNENTVKSKGELFLSLAKEKGVNVRIK